MMEFLGAAAASSVGFLLAWLYVRQQRSPSPVAAPASPASLAELMASLDKPISRGHTVAMGRSALEQFETAEEVGLIVIAVEPDLTHLHSASSAVDKIHAIDLLLDAIDQQQPREAMRAATNACRRALGLREAAR